MISILAFQSAVPAFLEKVGLMLLEKLGVGLVVLVAVIAGQWIIERYKGRRAVWTEISKSVSSASLKTGMR